jgi:type VI protein secretion system component Hcp
MAIDAYVKLKGIAGETLDAFFSSKSTIQVDHLSLGDSEKETEWVKQYRVLMDLLQPVLDEAGLKIVVVVKKKKGGGPPPKKAKATGPHDRLRNSLDKVKVLYKTNAFKEILDLLEKIRTQRMPAMPDSESLNRFDVEEELKKLVRFTKKEQETFNAKEFKKAKERAAAELGGDQLDDESVDAGAEFQQQKLCNVVISKNLDKASPALFKKFCAYRVLSKDESAAAKKDQATIATGMVWARKSVGGFYMEWELRDIFVIDLTWTSDSEGAVTENLTLQASAVKLTYRPQDAKGVLGNGVINQWDFQASAADFEAVGNDVFS